MATGSASTGTSGSEHPVSADSPDARFGKDQTKIVQISESSAFRYMPPPSAYGAKRILLKPNWGYPKPHPITVGLPVMHEVIAGIRRVSTSAEILIVEGVCSPVSAAVIAEKLGVGELLALDGVRFLDADTLPCQLYPNTASAPQRFASLSAPTIISEVDCRISISCLKRTTLKSAVLMSCAIKNLYGLLPRAEYHARSPHSRGQLHRPDVQKIIADVYWTLGILFDGAVVDATQKFVSRDWEPDIGTAVPCGKIVWGDDLLAVDRRACELAEEGMPEYLAHIACMTVSRASDHPDF